MAYLLPDSLTLPTVNEIITKNKINIAKQIYCNRGLAIICFTYIDVANAEFNNISLCSRGL